MAPAPTLTSTHLPYFLLLQADQAPHSSPKTPKNCRALENSMVTRSSRGRRGEKE